MRESIAAIALIVESMNRAKIRTVYELFLLSDVPRSTLHRWLRGVGLRLPVEGVKNLIEAISEYAQTDESTHAFAAILRDRNRPSPLSCLQSECRLRRVPYPRMIAAIQAARLAIVPVEQSNSNSAIQSEVSNEIS